MNEYFIFQGRKYPTFIKKELVSNNKYKIRMYDHNWSNPVIFYWIDYDNKEVNYATTKTT